MHHDAGESCTGRSRSHLQFMRKLASAMACPVLFLAAVASAQTDPVTPLSMFGMGTACGDSPCPPPSDPRMRDAFVLRLQTLPRPPAYTMPGGFGERVTAERLAQEQRRVAEAAAKDPASLLARGAGEAYSGRHAAAQTMLERALSIAVAEKDAPVQAASLSNLGVVAAMQGRFGEARARLNEALRLFRTIANEPRIPQRLYAPQELRLPPGLSLPPASAAAAVADMQSATRKMQLGLLVQQAKRGAFLVLLNQGSLAAHLAQYDDAVALLQAAVEAADPELDDGGRRVALGELAVLYRKTGRAKEFAEFDRRYRSAARAQDDQALQFTTSEVTLAPTGIRNQAAPIAAAPHQGAAAAPAPAAPPPESVLPDSAARRMQQKLERLIRGAMQPQMEQTLPLLAACESGVCATPGDPSTRSAYLLRLAGVAATIQVAPPAAEGRRDGEARLLNAAGVKLAVAGKLEAARAEWTKALQTSPRMQTEAAVKSNMGVVAAFRGRPDEARTRWQEAIRVYDRLAKESNTATESMAAKGAFGALPQEMAAMFEREAAASGQLLVLLNLAHFEAHLGRHAEADGWLRQAGEHARRDQAGGSALVLGERAAIERLRGRPDAAENDLRRAQAGTAPNEFWKQIEVGFLNLPAVTTTGAGSTAFIQPPSPATVPPMPAARPSKSTASSEDAMARLTAASEAVHARLAADAAELERAGNVAGALTAYARAAIIASAAGHAERERSALGALQRLRAARGEVASSIFHGKRVVNALQGQRQSLTELEPAARRAFFDGRKQGYVLLAQTLIDHDRLPEAEVVLRLLKEDEGQQFEQSTSTRGTVPLSTSETSALLAYEQLAERIRPLEARRARLASSMTADGVLDSRASIERARLGTLTRTEEGIDTFEANVGEYETEAASCRRTLAKRSRTVAEASQLSDCALSLSAFSQALERGSESVRALKRDLTRFAVQPTAVELRQIDIVLRRFTELQSRMAPTLALVRELPASREGDQRTIVAYLGTVIEVGRLQELWNLQLEIEGLADRLAGVDAGLDARAGTPAFAPAANAVVETGQRLMKALPAGTVALYYLQGEDRLDILGVSAGGWQKAKVRMSRSQVALRIDAFRDAVGNPKRDALPEAQAMYKVLIAPVDGLLKSALATTLMVALEGPLRYVPFAALHDGNSWLVERYAVSLYTTAAPTSLVARPARIWRAAAFGAIAGSAKLRLSPLPGVRNELLEVVREPTRHGQGVMEGEIRFDREFTAQSMRDALTRRPNLIHIASHFVYEENDAASSYLLLGDGGRLTLAQIGADFRFDQIDMVTLSACDTALVAGNGFGQEVEALGTLLQARGAASVMSTLWPVADESTPQFMRRFYEARQGGGSQMSRAQALRVAQLALVGSASGTDGAAPAASDQRGAQRPGANPMRPEPGRPFAHPYYWAPFVLMGNWL